MYVPEPIFVKPASKPLLEIADTLSFLIARFHYCNMHNKKIDVDLNILGEVMYSNYEIETGDFIYKRVNYYPWKLVYPIING